jgi:hypothetical protein
MLSLCSPTDIVQGVSWYATANTIAQNIANATGIDVIRVAGVISALSPNNRWERNIADAHRLILDWTNGDLTTKVCTFGRNKAKAHRILALESPDREAVDKILTGRKTVAFFRCILGDGDRVCVDGHAYSIWLGTPIATTETPAIGKGLYQSIERSYQLVATRSVDICGQALSPAQVQAATWITYRKLFRGIL